MRYPSDDLTAAERARLAPHFTDLDGPVSRSSNLPETVKGALFARYSRYPGTLRRLFLDEFADSLPESAAGYDGERGQARGRALRADLRRLRRRLASPSSAAPTSPASGRRNILTKILQRPRLGAYLEQSHALHRLRRADARRRLPLLPRPGARPRVRGGDGLRCSTPTPTRSRACARGSTRPTRAPTGESDAARRRAVNAKALDLLRGLLPAASLSHMGIYATGQAYEQLILHLLGHPLPEARRYGEHDPRRDQGGHAELRRARRAPRARRRVGRATSSAGARPASAGPRASGLDRDDGRRRTARPCGSLHVDGDEEQLLAALLFEAAGVERGAHARGGRAARRRASARALLADLVGERAQPPPPPRPRLRGAALPLRDRLGLRRVPRPPAPPHADRAVAGADARPRRRRARRGRRRRRAATLYARALERSRAEYERLAAAGLRRRRAVRALPRLPDPLRARPQRARGDAPDRAALGPRGPSRATARSRTRCTRRSPSATRRSPRR